MGAFGGGGFDRDKMSDIAYAAEVGKGTLWEYFDDKEELPHLLSLDLPE